MPIFFITYMEATVPNDRETKEELQKELIKVRVELIKINQNQQNDKRNIYAPARSQEEITSEKERQSLLAQRLSSIRDELSEMDKPKSSTCIAF